MKVGDHAMRSIWRQGDGVEIIDQTALPHVLKTRTLSAVEEAAEAIATMRVRGAPLIGACAAYGMALGLGEQSDDAGLQRAADVLIKTRPTASNLRWAVERVCRAVETKPPSEREAAAWGVADDICEEDIKINQAIGEHGRSLISEVADKRPGPVNILTHCNAGWLATVDIGTALAPIYLAHDAGIGVHVWVSETRPRNQGARLTAWELGQHGVPYTLVADNAAGYLMRQGRVDLCITGTDRVTADGDVCNKIGTYLKALAARDCGVPFHVALPGPTIDWSVTVDAIPIEERVGDEVAMIEGCDDTGSVREVAIGPRDAVCANPAFDVTPAALVTSLITERGICPASTDGLRTLYPDGPATTTPTKTSGAIHSSNHVG